MILIVVIIILLLIIIPHYIKYHKKNKEINIIQVDKPLENNQLYQEYIYEMNPIIFKHHTIENLKTKVSPLTIIKKEMKNSKFKDFVYHISDTLFISAIQPTTISICNPSQLKHFSIQKKKKPFIFLKNKNSQYSFIDIQLDANMICMIPRFWIFSVTSSVDSFYNHTVFTKLFSIVS